MNVFASKGFKKSKELAWILKNTFNTPGVDYTIILWTAFMWTDPKSTKKTDSLTVFFTLLGSERVKA